MFFVRSPYHHSKHCFVCFFSPFISCFLAFSYHGEEHDDDDGHETSPTSSPLLYPPVFFRFLSLAGKKESSGRKPTELLTTWHKRGRRDNKKIISRVISPSKTSIILYNIHFFPMDKFLNIQLLFAQHNTQQRYKFQF